MSDATQPSRFSPRTLRWALIGSLALNVLVIGAVVGSLCLGRDGPHGKGMKSGGSALFHFARTLPRERSDFIRQKVADAVRSVRAISRHIPVEVNMMWGYPFETLEQFARTMELRLHSPFCDPKLGCDLCMLIAFDLMKHECDPCPLGQ